MLSERVYRRLLAAYPREYRREYEEPMVQLFRDRMRRDGGGFGSLAVWAQMIFDLVGAAFKEHKEGADMRKLTSIGIALAVVLVAGGIGIGTLMAQSKGDVSIAVIQDGDTKTFTATGSGIAEAMRQAVEDGAIGQEAADEIVLAFEDGDGPADAWRYEFGSDGAAEALRQAVEEGEIAQTTADAIVQIVDGRFEMGLEALNGAKVSVLEDAETLTFSEAGRGDDVGEALRQAVQAGAITQDQASEIVLSLEGNGPASVWRYDGGEDGVAGAVRQAVEDGVMSQELAEWILRSFDG